MVPPKVHHLAELSRLPQKGFIVYQMGRLCGGAHEISGIKAPIFLHGWVGGGGTGDGGGE